MKNYLYPQGGMGLITTARIEVALKSGHHVHSHKPSNDVRCEGGDPECPMWGDQLEDAMHVWNLRNTK